MKNMEGEEEESSRVGKKEEKETSEAINLLNRSLKIQQDAILLWGRNV